jgi:hypothetical protein
MKWTTVRKMASGNRHHFETVGISLLWFPTTTKQILAGGTEKQNITPMISSPVLSNRCASGV